MPRAELPPTLVALRHVLANPEEPAEPETNPYIVHYRKLMKSKPEQFMKASGEGGSGAYGSEPGEPAGAKEAGD